MSGETSAEVYLAKALEAEKMARQADKILVREAWLRIAGCHREMARRVLLDRSENTREPTSVAD